MPLENPGRCLVDPLFGHPAFLHQLDHQFGPGLGAHLVHTGVDDHLHVVLDRGLALQGRLERAVANHAPVGTDSPLEAELAIEDFGGHMVGIVDIQGIVVGAAIVAHGRQRAFLDAFFPGEEMVFLVVAGIDQPAAGAVQMGTAAGPVLEVDQDLSGTDLLSLRSLDEGSGHLCRQFGRFREAAHVAAPPGLRDHVDLRAEEHVQAHGAVLFGHDLAEAAHHAGIAPCGDAHLALTVGNVGEILGAAHVTAQLGAVARVRGEHDGDAQAGAFCNLLHAVGPVGELLGCGDAIVENATEILLFDIGLGSGRPAHLAHRHGTGILPAGTDRTCVALFFRPAEGFLLLVREVILYFPALIDGDVGVEHQAHFLLQRHLADKVGDALVHRQAPVLVRIQFPVLVEVFELELPFGQDLHFAGTQLRLGGFRGAPQNEGRQHGQPQ